MSKSAVLDRDTDLFNDDPNESEALIVDWDNNMLPTTLKSVVPVRSSTSRRVPYGFLRNPCVIGELPLVGDHL